MDYGHAQLPFLGPSSTNELIYTSNVYSSEIPEGVKKIESKISVLEFAEDVRCPRKVFDEVQNLTKPMQGEVE